MNNNDRIPSVSCIFPSQMTCSIATWRRTQAPVKENVSRITLKDKSGVGMITATMETYHLLTRTLTFVSHFELSNDCRFLKRSDDLGHIMFL